MTRALPRRAALALAAASLAGRAVAQDFKGKQLTAQGFGGATQDVIQQVVLDPLDSRLGCRSTQVSLQSAAAFARMKAEAAAPQIDLYQFSGGQEQEAATQGLAAKLDGVPNLPAIPGNLRGADWVTYGIIAQGLLYRTDKVKEPPRSYLDILRPEFDGHVAFPAITNGYGMDFLVMLARAQGGGENDIEPGFKSMEKIARDATLFKAASEVPTLFAQADVWIMPYDSASALRAAQAGLPVAFVGPKEGSPSVPITTCIAAKSSNLDLAKQAVNAFLSPACQIGLADRLGWAPTNPQTQLPEAVAQRVPRLDQLIWLDRAKINAGRSAWTERWNREIAR